MFGHMWSLWDRHYSQVCAVFPCSALLWLWTLRQVLSWDPMCHIACLSGSFYLWDLIEFLHLPILCSCGWFVIWPKKLDFFFSYACGCFACMYICAPHMVPLEVKRGHPISWNLLELQTVVSYPFDAGASKRLTSEPSLQPSALILKSSLRMFKNTRLSSVKNTHPIYE